MDQLEKVGKKLLGSQIEDSLMEYILNEPVAIGEKLPNEFELAEKFGVGRSTIREAVKSLVSKGVLEVRRGSGTYVVSTSSLEEDPLGLGRFEDKYHLALELFEVRLMLEPEIAALADYVYEHVFVHYLHCKVQPEPGGGNPDPPYQLQRVHLCDPDPPAADEGDH